MKPLEEIDVFIFDTLTGILFDKVPEYKEIVEMGKDSFFSDRSTYLFMNEILEFRCPTEVLEVVSTHIETYKIDSKYS
ncbi:hypothetical protein [Sphingobacterium sp.]|uniref:hypothetical protein n=1 Tax=Sphingobacterium sp. TaxID=341027 RepID=UPI0031D8C2B0